MSHTLVLISQLVIAFGIYNVWLLRANSATEYRGGGAQNMEEEFRVYGLSTRFMKVVKIFKLSFATLLLLGVLYRPLACVGAVGMGGLMLAAVVMHAKVHDPIKKTLPALSLLALSLVVAFSTSAG